MFRVEKKTSSLFLIFLLSCSMMITNQEKVSSLKKVTSSSGTAKAQKSTNKSASKKSSLLAKLKQTSNDEALINLNKKIAAGGTKLKAITACMQGFLKILPAEFCYHSGETYVPSCESGWSGSGSTGIYCTRDCSPGYTFDFELIGSNRCLQNCPSGYSRNTFDDNCSESGCWWGCKSFTADKYDVTTKNLTCKSGFFSEYGDGMHNEFVLCKQDCPAFPDYEYELCLGTTGCSLKGHCLAAILTMGLDFVFGFIEFVVFFVSFGTSTAAKPATSTVSKSLRTLFSKLGRSLLSASLKSIKNFLLKRGKKEIMEMAFQKAWKLIPSVTKGRVKMASIRGICNAVSGQMFDENVNALEAPLDFVKLGIQALEDLVMSIPNAFSACDAIDLGNDTPNDEILCADLALKAVSLIDPTGISLMASAVLNPVCEYPN